MSESVVSPPRSAAVVGCGVIGAAWAARLRLRGVDVRVFDPAPNAEQLLASVTASAVDAWDGLGLPTDRLGSLVMCDSIGAAVEGCEFVQESVPERLDLKHDTLSAIDAAIPVGSVVASSTSGGSPVMSGTTAATRALPSRVVDTG